MSTGRPVHCSSRLFRFDAEFQWSSLRYKHQISGMGIKSILYQGWIINSWEMRTFGDLRSIRIFVSGIGNFSLAKVSLTLDR